ncbi:protein KTI12 homolog [Watersipora subatra]|uniref:protein KTI12 homolog n=1 Tax=Watersipora subatra TaxID=2589382 RepID=UPI00355C6FE5
MPLLVVTGYPCSGKTTRVEKIINCFNAKHKDIVVVNDGQFNGFDREVIYGSSRNEKNLRAFLKSETQKHLNKDTLVIVDSLNYIKGFRYELHCITKAAQTPHCVLWCDIGKDRALELNHQRSKDKYSDKLMEELIMRYEEPNGQTRWDSPLFILQIDNDLALEPIEDALFKSKPPPPNMSTVAQPLQATDFMYELDKVTNETVKHIVNCQRSAMPGDKIRLPAGGEVELMRHSTLAELNKIRRQFIVYMKMNPVSDCSQLSTMFIQYLQTSLL